MTNMAVKERFISGPPLKPLDASISVADVIFSALQRNKGDTIAQREAETGRELTYGQLKRECLSVAQGLIAEGIGEGAVVAVVTYNSQEAHVITLASILVGATVAPLDSALTSDELGHLIKLIEPKVIFCDGVETLKNIEKAVKVLTYTPKIVGANIQNHTYTSFKDLKHSADDEFKPVLQSPEDHVVLIMPTSGTTGLPKGVLLSNTYIRNIVFPMPESVKLSIFTSSPLFWISGIVTLLNGILTEYTVTFLRQPARENTLLKAIQDYKFDLWVASPTALLGIADSSFKNMYDLSSLKMVFAGGASMSTQSVLQVQNELFHNKVPVLQAYGMTEIGIISSCRDGSEKSGSTGLLRAGCKCKVGKKIENVETGESLGPGIKGEVCIKAPYMMNGYINNPEATAALFDKDGWIHTGDIGYYDEEGYLFVIDRIKELIKYKSYHISPTELEDILRKHPAVKDVLVVGVPHPTDGDHATAFVIAHKTVTESELVQYVAERVSESKQLRGGVRFVEEILYTPTGKPKRRAMRDQLIKEFNNPSIKLLKF